MRFLTVKNILLGSLFLGALVFIYFQIPELSGLKYNPQTNEEAAVLESFKSIESAFNSEKQKNSLNVTHIETPEDVKAIYMTSWTAGNKELREKLVKIADETEINAIIIDVKDYSGRISFEVNDPYLKEIGASEKRIPDIAKFISTLHKKNIYVIGRISVFQDPHLASKLPNLAVRKKSNKEEIWSDYKGLSWLDPGVEAVWDYTVRIGREAYTVGFDELNFDYIRFPADGNMNDIYYPFSDDRIKTEVLLNFFAYLKENLKESGVVLSADLFGMTTTNTDDLNIGQFLEYALPYFDYIAPMVYPSHYPKGWNGIEKPAEKPYKVIKYSLDKAIKRMKAIGYSPLKLRPWLQDFNLGATYTKEMVQTQMQAVYDSGLTSWMLWDPANTYTTAALSVNKPQPATNPDPD